MSRKYVLKMTNTHEKKIIMEGLPDRESSVCLLLAMTKTQNDFCNPVYIASERNMQDRVKKGDSIACSLISSV